jgi:DNA-binding IclR family transcriptional regulator
MIKVNLTVPGHVIDADGLTKRADILASTGWDKNKVARALNELKAAGLVTQPKQGFYRLVDKPAAAEQSA